MYSPPHIVIVDHPGSGADGVDLAAIAAAIQRQLDTDFGEAYERSATIGAASSAGPTDWVLGLFADPDQPGALGYHDLAPNGMPFGKVFPLLDAQDGANLSTTIDHETLEMLEDFSCDLARHGTDGHQWADEPCDAVEQDEYEIDGIKLSNFVLPGWYSGRGKYDFLGKLSAPLTITPGGYAQYFDQQGWHQVTHQERQPRPYRQMLAGRSARRRFARALDTK